MDKLARKSSRSALKNLLKRAVFSLTLLIGILAALDLTAWLIIRTGSSQKVQQSDPLIFYRLRPGSRADDVRLGDLFPDWWNKNAPNAPVTVSDQGFRGTPHVPEKGPFDLRVICLGDSITFGLGVDDKNTYPALLDEALSRALPGPAVTVINAGVMGYTSQQGMFDFRSRLSAFQPDVVIWGYGFNDSKGNPLFKRMDVRLIPSGPEEEQEIPLPWRILRFIVLRPSSQLIQALVIGPLWKARVGKMVAQLEEAAAKGVPAVSPGAAAYQDCRVPPENYEQNLTAMAQLAKQNYFLLIVAAFIGTPDVYRDIDRRVAEKFQLPFVDLRGEFESLIFSGNLAHDPNFKRRFAIYEKGLQTGALTKNPLLYLTIDGLHPNNIGQLIIAGKIAPIIVDDYNNRVSRVRGKR